MKNKKTLITGGAGFIGSEFVRQSVSKGYKIAVLDKLTYAGDLARIQNELNKIDFYKIDIANKKKMDSAFKKIKPQIIVHFAAETHVDRSLRDKKPFERTNVLGTKNLIELSLRYKVKKFLHISTDEVYGSNTSSRKFTEESRLNPMNPYAKTKADAEILIQAAIKNNAFPALIIRPCNCYGPWQYPEKLIPVAIYKAIKNNKIPIYGKGEQMREWLYVSDCIQGVLTMLRKGQTGDIYNIGSSYEQKNIDTVKTILKGLKKPQKLIRLVKDRKNHDFRYAVNSSKLKNLGWSPVKTFHMGINETIHWNITNFQWLETKRNDCDLHRKNIQK